MATNVTRGLKPEFVSVPIDMVYRAELRSSARWAVGELQSYLQQAGYDPRTVTSARADPMNYEYVVRAEPLPCYDLSDMD